MIFVTGGTGLVGMHLLASLSADNHRIKAVKRSGSNTDLVKEFFAYSLPNDPEAFERIQWVEVDLMDYADVASAMANCETVYHAAAIVSFHPKDFKEMVDFNVGATANLVNVALELGIASFGYVSSVAALGRKDNEPVTEDTEWKYDAENSTYAGSKYNSELEVWRGVEEGLNAHIVNPAVIMGIGDFSRSSAEVFKQMEDGFPYYPGGSNGFVAVQDVVDVLRRMAEQGSPSRQYMLVSENWSYKELFGHVAQALNKKPPAKLASQRMMNFYCFLQRLKELFTGRRAFVTKESVRNASQNYTYDASRVKKELNYNFEDLPTVIQETGRYFLGRQQRDRKIGN